MPLRMKRPAPGWPPFAMVACQRSGTHLLREVLNSNSRVAILSEPFQKAPQPISWWNWVRGLADSRQPALHFEQALQNLDEYVAHVQRDALECPDWYGEPKTNGYLVGLDIKYNQLDCGRPVMHDLRAAPFLLDFFRLRGWKIVHLVRSNLLQTALSAIIANQRSVWQNYDGSVIDRRFRIPTEEMLYFAEWVSAERAEFERLCAGLPVHTCTYEGLVDDLKRLTPKGWFPEDTQTLAPLAGFLQVSNRFRFNGLIHKVINRPYAELLENLDEVADAASRSPLLSEHVASLE